MKGDVTLSLSISFAFHCLKDLRKRMLHLWEFYELNAKMSSEKEETVIFTKCWRGRQIAGRNRGRTRYDGSGYIWVRMIWTSLFVTERRCWWKLPRTKTKGSKGSSSQLAMVTVISSTSSFASLIMIVATEASRKNKLAVHKNHTAVLFALDMYKNNRNEIMRSAPTLNL